MQHVTSLEELRLDRPASVAIGAFDGVHRGHQALIGGLVQAAHASGRAAIVVTFFPHPSVVLRGRRPSFYISTPEEKAALLAELGVDALVTHPFNETVAKITAAEFVDRLVSLARLSEVWCGADFSLGHNREGNVDFLRAAGERQGFTVNVQPPLMMDGEVVSSTRIRQTLRDGAVEQAARYLGRPFRLAGTVVEGAKRGRQIGIPTANVSIWEERASPAVGVYACWALHGGRKVKAAVNIGFRPTFEGGEARPIIEAHLLDFSEDLYTQSLALDFVARLRPEMKFAGIEALVQQIRQDIETTRGMLHE